MPSIIKNKDTEECLRNLLLQENYRLNKTRGDGELGTEVATKVIVNVK